MNNKENPFAFLEQVDISQVAQLLKQELPFVSGVALSRMPPIFTAKVMAEMPEELRSEIAGAMSKYRKIPNETLYDIAEELEKKINSFPTGNLSEKKNSILANLDLGAISRDINKLKIRKEEKPTSTQQNQHVDSRIISPEEFIELQRSKEQTAKTTCHTEKINDQATNFNTQPKIKEKSHKDKQIDPELAKEIALQKALKQRENKRKTTRIISSVHETSKGEKRYKAQKVDGMALAAHILREANPELRSMIMAEIPELYNKLNKKMFAFADLEKSGQLTIGKVFSGLDPKIAALALRFASENIKNKALTSVSRRKAQLIIDEIKLSANDKVKITDIEDAQQSAIDYAVELQNRGEIIIDPDDSSIV